MALAGWLCHCDNGLESAGLHYQADISTFPTAIRTVPASLALSAVALGILHTERFAETLPFG